MRFASHLTSHFVPSCLAALAALTLPIAGGCEAKNGTLAPGDAGTTTAALSPLTPAPKIGAEWVAANYEKRELRVPMRDGTTLFTVVYTPREALRARAGGGDLPLMLFRTPYSVGPYGEDEYPDKLGPQAAMMRDGYIFAYQDVRGRFMSDGEYLNMTPHVDDKHGPADVDESSDTYDTIAWLLEEIDGHNGRVGQWGISYPGFYAAAGVIDAHPALVAVSPQAPIADWWRDDFHHNGAFLIPHLFNFISRFGVAREGHTQEWAPPFEHGTPDGFAFFQRLGPARNANERYFEHALAFWDAVMDHPNYDEFWRRRDLLPHLAEVESLGPAVMTVGGWFDAEDLYGPLQIYKTLEGADPKGDNRLVMGPWRHGGWARSRGDSLGDVSFGGPTSPLFQAEVERRFFATELEHHSADEFEGCAALPEAFVFETGANQWRQFDHWPPQDTTPDTLWFGSEGRLLAQAPGDRRGADRFVSDPAKPVPYTTAVAKGMTREYMSDDQRFAAQRPDVLVYQTEPLTAPLTLAGPITADLWVSTDQRDADWIVKLIDVFPDDAPDHDGLRAGMHMGGYQMMVRSEVVRGRFRDDPAKPEPFTPKRPTEVSVPLQDVLHTFEAGHRVMVQVQSTWFPLIDLNPQAWVDNIYMARDDDFVAAVHQIYRDQRHASSIQFGRLPAGEAQPLSCVPDPLAGSSIGGHPDIQGRVESAGPGELMLTHEVRIDAPVDEVWRAYTTAAGWEAWVAPHATVDLRPGGLIETHYDPGATIGDEGTNRLYILNLAPERMLTLQAEPSPYWPASIRDDAGRLFNVVTFEPTDDGGTLLISRGLGYRDTAEHRELLGFFLEANEQLYLGLLRYLEEGIEVEHPVP